MRLPSRPERPESEPQQNNRNGFENFLVIVGAMVVGAVISLFFFMKDTNNEVKEPPPVSVVQSEESISTKEINRADEKPPRNFYDAGEYKIGVDIPADEYLMIGEG